MNIFRYFIFGLLLFQVNAFVPHAIHKQKYKTCNRIIHMSENDNKKLQRHIFTGIAAFMFGVSSNLAIHSLIDYNTQHSNSNYLEDRRFEQQLKQFNSYDNDNGNAVGPHFVNKDFRFYD